MVLPTPSRNEAPNAFIGRCMSDKTMNTEYKDAKQRRAVCYSQSKKTGKTQSTNKGSKETIEE